MERIVVLAGSLREANAYCREVGIRATFAKTPAQIRRATKIIGLAGFDRRRDKYALLNSAEARIKYGKGVTYVDATDWEMPKSSVTQAEIAQELTEGFADSPPVYQLDLEDPETLEALKVALNKVGLTLKKLPAKKQAEAPVIDAPMEF